MVRRASVKYKKGDLVKKEPQSFNDCVLATIAMLADIPLTKAEEHAQAAARDLGFPWDGNWWSVFGYLGREGAISLARETARRAGLKDFTPLTRVCEVMGNSTGTSPDLRGRGQISVELPEGGHAMAYEDGFIYDGDFPSAPRETWEEYVARKGNDILKVIVTLYAK